MKTFFCLNCGECCGLIPVTEDDWQKIRKAVAGMPESERERLQNQPRGPLTCPFRDEEKTRCSVYDVRPLICRMQGLYIGLECPQNPQAATGTLEAGRARLNKHIKSPIIGILGVDLGWSWAMPQMTEETKDTGS